MKNLIGVDFGNHGYNEKFSIFNLIKILIREWNSDCKIVIKYYK